MKASTRALDRIVMVGKNFSSGFAIEKSVGDWSRGAKNNFSDVETVQLLLEYVSKVTGQKEFNPQGIDGKISRKPGQSNTVKAIRAYQRGLMKSPDGVVDPDGRTLRKLQATAAGNTPKSEASTRSVMQTPQPSDGNPPWLYTFNGLNFFNPFSLLPTTPPQQPNWISIAEEELGTKEIAGKKHNPRIIEYHATTTSKPTQDESPWCASFVNWVLMKAGYEGTDSAWSHSWKNWGDSLSKPALGVVAFIDWGKVYPDKPDKQGKGHVGFVVGKTASGRIVLLGGNQNNKVSYSAFKASHIVTYRVPKGYKADPSQYDLPILKITGGGSGFESTR